MGNRVYDIPPNCPLVFTEPKQVHETIRARIYNKSAASEEKARAVDEALNTPPEKTAVSLFPGSAEVDSSQTKERTSNLDQAQAQNDSSEVASALAAEGG